MGGLHYLINAYRILSGWVHNENLTEEDKKQIERVIADIQLFGSKKMINVLNNFIDNYNKGGDVTKLLDTLVAELRSELKMEQLDSRRRFFCFK